MPSENIVNLLMQQFGPTVLEKVGASLGINRETAQTAVGSTVPALLASFAGLASRPEGAAQLNAALQRQDAAPGDASTMLADALRSAPSGEGRSMLDSLLGGPATTSLMGGIAKASGISQGTASTLLSFVAPVVMGFLRRHQKNERLDARGLASMLSAQMGNIGEALPSGLAGTLRETGVLGSLANQPGESTRTASGAVRNAAADMHAMAGSRPGAATAPTWQPSGTGPARAMPFIPLGIVGIAAIVLLGWWLHGATGVHTDVRQGAEQAASAASDLVVGQVDVGKDVTAAVGKVTTTLQSVTDPVAARNAVPQLDEATTQLNRLKDLKAQLPTAGKQALAEIVAKLQPLLQAAIDKVVAIPGVADILKPGLDTLMTSVNELRA